MKMPHSIAADADGRLYVADGGNARIQVFDNVLNLLAIYDTVGHPWAVCITRGPHQYLYRSSNSDKTDMTVFFTRSDNEELQKLPDVCRSARYLSANAISIVTGTATGWPARVPGRKRHCSAALIASSSRPKAGRNERFTWMLLHAPLGCTRHSTMIDPCTRARMASAVYRGIPLRISTGIDTPLPGR
jgi:hypothetical protein